MPPVDWGFLTGLAALLTAITGWWLGARKEKLAAAEAARRAALEAAEQERAAKRDGADISRQAVEAAQNFWQVTLDEQNERLAEQGQRIAELEADKAIRDQERAEAARVADRLETHLVSLHDWIDRGAKPPPPRRPAWLRPGPFSPHTTTNQPQPEE